jgi:hypothetical protein
MKDFKKRGIKMKRFLICFSTISSPFIGTFLLWGDALRKAGLK